MHSRAKKEFGLVITVTLGYISRLNIICINKRLLSPRYRIERYFEVILTILGGDMYKKIPFFDLSGFQKNNNTPST